jgi:hypothetical protein
MPLDRLGNVKLFEQEGELYVLAKSEGRRAQETAMRRKHLTRLLKKLRAMRRSLPSLVQLLMRLGAAKSGAGRAFQFVHVQVPGEEQEVARETFQFHVDKKKLQAAEWRDGHYLLRSNLTAGDPSVLWARYVQLTQIESVFRSLKSELGIRPIYNGPICPAPLVKMPHADSQMEDAVFTLASHVFLQTPNANACLGALERLVGAGRLQYFLLFLTFVRAAH